MPFRPSPAFEMLYNPFKATSGRGFCTNHASTSAIGGGGMVDTTPATTNRIVGAPSNTPATISTFQKGEIAKTLAPIKRNCGKKKGGNIRLIL